MVEDEGTKDVERLLGVRKSAGVVREEAGGIVLEFHGGLAKEQKGPGGREVAVNFPFVPDAFESLPRNLSHWAIKRDEDPIDVRNVEALVVHGQSDLVDLVPDEFFPRLSTRTPSYLVPSPFDIHLKPTSVPHYQVLSFLLAQMVVDLCQFTFAPEATLKVVSTFYALSRFEEVPLSPAQGFLRNEDVIEDGPPFHESDLVRFDDVWEDRLESSGEHLGQNFVYAPEERNRSPIIESGVVSGFRNEGYYPFVYICGGFALIEQRRERLKEVRRHLLLVFLEEFHGYAVVAWRFALRKGSDGSTHLF
ncbi:unnamed protein product [Sphagnum troendelagicum]